MSTPTQFFLERLDDDGRPTGMVDEVDQFIFNNRDHIIQQNEQPRYSASYLVTFDDGTFQITFHGNTAVLAHFTRLVGGSTSTGVTHFCVKPATVILQKKNRKPILYNTADKTQWKMV